MRMSRPLVLACALLALAACTTQVPDPIPAGSGINDLKRSPCACTEIPMRIPPEFLRG